MYNDSTDSIQMPINGLIRYGIGLVLFTNINALEVIRNKLYTLVDNLKGWRLSKCMTSFVLLWV